MLAYEIRENVSQEIKMTGLAQKRHLTRINSVRIVTEMDMLRRYETMPYYQLKLSEE